MTHYFDRQISDAVRRTFCGIVIAVCVFYLSLPTRAQDATDDQEDAVQIFNQGQDAHEKGDLPEAVRLYEKALKLVPDFPEAELQLGNALVSLGRTDDAEKAFRRAVGLRPEWSLAAAGLGSVLVTKQHYDEARPILAKALELDSQNFPALSAVTELLIRTHAGPDELQKALSRIKELTAKANPTASLWSARGSLENALGDTKSAKSSLSRALEIDPKNKNSLFELAGIALKENDTSQAEDIAKSLEKLTNSSEAAVSLHARAIFNSGKVDEAIKLLDSIKSPSKETLDLRSAMLASGSTNAAELEKQLVDNAKNAVVLERLCALYRVGDPTKALDYCRRASEADPRNIKPAIGYGAALVQAKRFDEAVALLQKLLAIAPDNFTIHANLATALFQSKRLAEAKAEYLWMTNRQPDLAITYYFLAISHDQLREYMDAMANYQQFLKLADPEQQKLEIEKVNLRLPGLQTQLKEKKKGRE